MAEVMPLCADRTASPGGTAAELLLRAEVDFYESYPWCLNPYPTIKRTIEHLATELDRLGGAPEDWRADEARTNVYLLSCALLNAADDYQGGGTFRMPRKARALPLAGAVLGAAEMAAAVLRAPRRVRVRRWVGRWRPHFDAFVAAFVAEQPHAAGVGREMIAALAGQLPRDFLAQHIYFPSAFRKHDLSHFDVLALGRRFAAMFPDRKQPILLVGLRTAGSYFAPLLQAYLQAERYSVVDALTIRPDRGLGRRERAELRRCARAGRLAVILDDAPGAGGTLTAAVDVVRKAGFGVDATAVLVPVHPANRDWREHVPAVSLAGATVVTLEAEEWHKPRLLDPERVETLLAAYYRGRGFSAACVAPSAEADRLNVRLHDLSDEPRRDRLKRIFEVQLTAPDGRTETRYVLAKSVGWGWLGYHAFLAGRRLARFTPPLLGLRDGVLYSEWLPQAAPADPGGEDRERWIGTTAAYVAARAKSLPLEGNPLPTLGRHQHHDGFGLLDRILSKAYGGPVVAGLMRPSVRRRLCVQPCPRPTLIDGKMHTSEWLADPRGLLKTDYEHHGMGKNELNLTDPAYDLAEAILHFSLSPQEEKELLRLYAEESGDAGVGGRLFLNKLLAGNWAMASALKGLFGCQRPDERGRHFHHRFVAAWDFLTAHAARFCGALCTRPRDLRWRSPLVVLDIDGVLDRRVFGFPCTTAAGVEAVSLLHAHDFAVAVDTARSAGEVKEYCRAYGFAGGVAEYGSYLWDAVGGRGKVLVSPESLRQLDRARKALAKIPGVFLNDGYEFSIRACTYEDKAPPESRLHTPYALSSIRTFTCDGAAPAPLPTPLIRQVMAAPGLDRLRLNQTGSDTTITAREVDKGAGLAALRDWIGLADAETAAVGDSEPDLPMFRAATRCFAPAQVRCRRQARLLGCQVAPYSFQRGLLHIVRSLVHEKGGRCTRCVAVRPAEPEGDDLILDLLHAADWGRAAVLLAAVFNPRTYEAFLR